MGHGWPNHAASVRSRLLKHGSDHQILPRLDPRHQDGFVTWLEYVSFELWWFDIFVSYVNEGQSAADEHWKKLCDDGLINEEEEMGGFCEMPSIDPVAPACSPTEARVKMVRARRSELMTTTQSITHSRDDRLFKYISLAMELQKRQAMLAGQEAVVAWVKAQIPLAKSDQEAVLEKEFAGQLFEEEELNGGRGQGICAGCQCRQFTR
jgi:hypothetical protein